MATKLKSFTENKTKGIWTYTQKDGHIKVLQTQNYFKYDHSSYLIYSFP